MRRLSRILLNTLTAASLLLGAAMIVLWVRSHWVADAYYTKRPDGFLGYESARGTFEIFRTWEHLGLYADFPKYYRTPVSTSPPLGSWGKNDPGQIHDWRFAGLRFYSSDGGADHESGMSWRPCWAVDIPYALPTLLCAIPPILWTRTQRRRASARRLTPLCPTCGYDCRATPNRCSECGRPIPSPGSPREG